MTMYSWKTEQEMENRKILLKGVFVSEYEDIHDS